MTAEEIAEKLPIGIHDRDEAVQLIKEYAKQKCKEQRKICRRKAFETGIGISHSRDILKRIESAPEPEML